MTKLLLCGVCGRSFISGEVCNCPFCGAHKNHVFEFKAKTAKWRCSVCGYECDDLPDRCPVCAAKAERFVHIDPQNDESKSLFDLELSEIDITNAQKALDVEVSNSTFYFCAAKKSDSLNERYLFQSLGEVEHQHAVIWKNVLKLQEMPNGDDGCSTSGFLNLKESHEREDKAIKFYAEASETSENEKLKMLFKALVEIESDHLKMSADRIEAMA